MAASGDGWSPVALTPAALDRRCQEVPALSPRIVIEGMPEPSFWSDLLELSQETLEACVSALEGIPRADLTDLVVAKDPDSVITLLEQGGVGADDARLLAPGFTYLADGMDAEAWQKERVVAQLKANQLVEEHDQPPPWVDRLLSVIEGVATDAREKLRVRRRIASLMPTLKSVMTACDLRDITSDRESDAEPGQLVQEMVPVGIIRIADDEGNEPTVFQVQLRDVEEMLEALEELRQCLRALEARGEGGKAGANSGP